MIDGMGVEGVDGCGGVEQTGQQIGLDIPDAAGCSLQTVQYVFHMILPDGQKAASDKGIGIVCPCDADGFSVYSQYLHHQFYHFVQDLLFEDRLLPRSS